MAFFRADDTISGKEAKAQININGQIEDLLYAKSAEATFEKKKTEVNTLGKRGTQSKATGWSGTGTMTVYYATSLFRKLATQYIKTGKDFYFDLIITNEDPGSSIGKQTTVLYNCNIDSVILAKFDVESEVLEEEIPFTFDDADILDEFGKPVV